MTEREMLVALLRATHDVWDAWYNPPARLSLGTAIGAAKALADEIERNHTGWVRRGKE